MAEDTLVYRNFSSTAGFYNPVTGPDPIGGNFGRVGYVNLAKDYAALNRKNMRQTYNKGYPLCYVVEVEAIGDTSMAHCIEIYTAPETWVLKNAVRKWHMARNEMLKRVDALGKVGEYGRTIRPYLSVAHGRYGDVRPTFFNVKHDTQVSGGSTDLSVAYHETQNGVVGGTANGGEWTYTKIASVTDKEAHSGTILPVDDYELVLTGDHSDNAGAESGGSRFFTHVSMMRSYLESRRNASSIIQDNTGGGTIQSEPNPLSDLIADSLSAGEIKEVVQDIQREKPPYDSFSTGDSGENALSANDALDLTSKCLLSTSTSYLKDKEVIRIPMGLFHIRASASNHIGASGAKSPGMRIRLLGIEKCQG